jgi:excisionase family DNA binding protein
MDVVVAGIAVAAFAATVLVLARTGSSPARGRPRTVSGLDEEGWLTTDEVAAMLGVGRAEIAELVEREAIPHYLVAGGRRSDPAAYRFRRAEIERWTIG